MNRHSWLWIALATSFAIANDARGSDFSCLRALIPASDHYWVHKHRSRYALPHMNNSQSSIAIGEWENDRLIHVFVYTEKSSFRFSSVRILGDEPRELKTLEPEWLKTHLLAIPMESMEVFRIHPESPRHAVKAKTTGLHEKLELGGILVDDKANPAILSEPIQEEIQLRLRWVRDHNLDSGRFMKWNKAQAICH
jgi:hypothetical protein